MDKYKMTIGLEIHAELNTKSKMFCSCRNIVFDKDEITPNSSICPVCMGYPGTLPTVNKEAVKKALMIGIAISGNTADFTEFDRKNYFYPDIPKGYQISQYQFPLVSGGELSGVKIKRVHLEEDTAKSSHDDGEYSLVDYNRAGVPLSELVTEPVIKSVEEAVNFAKEYQLLLQYLDVSGANMEKGEMRVEVNISVSKDESFGTKVEIKNINSFKAVGKAIEFEFKRQVSLIEKGEKVVQETRGFDENKGVTFSQRNKETANDYRYFPDPDIPKIVLSLASDINIEELRNNLPETPSDKRDRLLKFGVKSDDIEVYVGNRTASNFFESVANTLGGESNLIQIASNYITSDLIGFSKNKKEEFSSGKLTDKNFGDIIKMVSSGNLSSRGAKDLIRIIYESGGDPNKIATDKKLLQNSNEEEINTLVEEIINENKDSVGKYLTGKDSLLQFFVGLAMKKTNGTINPEIFKKVFGSKINK